MKKLIGLLSVLCLGLVFVGCGKDVTKTTTTTTAAPTTQAPTTVKPTTAKPTTAAPTTAAPTTQAPTTVNANEVAKQEFIEDHADVLALTAATVTLEHKDAIAAAVTAFNALDEAVQELLANEAALLEDLTYAIYDLEDAAALLEEVNKAIAELEAFDLSNYREAEQAQATSVLAEQKALVAAATSFDDLVAKKAAAKAALAEIKTNAQYVIEEQGEENVWTFSINTVNVDAVGDATAVWTQPGLKLREVTEGTSYKWIASEWRYYIVFDAEGKIAFHALFPDSGYGCPGDPMLVNPAYTDYNSNPAYDLLEGFAPWQAGSSNHNLYNVVIPEGGFAVTAHGLGVADITKAFSFGAASYTEEVAIVNNPATFSSTLVAVYDTVNMMVVVYESVVDVTADIAAAKVDLASYKNAADYRKAEQAQLLAMLEEANTALDACTSVAEIEAVVAAAKAAADAVKTHAELLVEEAPAKPANALDIAFTAVDKGSQIYALDLNSQTVTVTGMDANADKWGRFDYAAQSGKYAKVVVVIEGGDGFALGMKLDAKNPNNVYDSTKGNKVYHALSEGYTVFEWDLLALGMDSAKLEKLVFWAYDGDGDTPNGSFKVASMYFIPDEEVVFAAPQDVIVVNLRDHFDLSSKEEIIPLEYAEVTATVDGEAAEVTRLNDVNYMQLGYQTVKYTAGNLGKSVEVTYLMQDGGSVWYSSLTVGEVTSVKQQGYCHKTHNIFAQNAWFVGADRLHVYDANYYTTRWVDGTVYTSGLMLVYNQNWELVAFRGVLGGQAFEVAADGSVKTSELAWGTNMLEGSKELLANGGYVVFAPTGTNVQFVIQNLLGAAEYVEGALDATAVTLNPYQVKHSYNVAPW